MSEFLILTNLISPVADRKNLNSEFCKQLLLTETLLNKTIKINLTQHPSVELHVERFKRCPVLCEYRPMIHISKAYLVKKRIHHKKEHVYQLLFISIDLF